MNNRFNEAASSWDAKPGRILMAEKFANEIIQIIKTKNYKVALEYGCGTGNVSFFLKNYFERITLADASQGMLDELKKKIDDAGITSFHPKLLDLEKDTFKEKYNVIYTLMTMHHVKNVEKVISEFKKMLLPEGLLIIGDLEKEDGDFHPYPENQDVHFGFEKDYLKQVLIDNNLDFIQYKVFYNMERTHTGVSKTYNLFSLTVLN